MNSRLHFSPTEGCELYGMGGDMERTAEAALLSEGVLIRGHGACMEALKRGRSLGCPSKINIYIYIGIYTYIDLNNSKGLLCLYLIIITQKHRHNIN